ncbi:Cobalt-precorrin-6y C15-methyltransferase [Lachnospiraceae bacterium TWA4]|nr:Cobalt-precorrin-6y C15-methyltransferase [Lachnospiraceae bacterium TWA4]
MKEKMRQTDGQFVIDATHPYAVVVSKNIKKACEEENKTYLRLLRSSKMDEVDEDCIIVSSVEEAVGILEQTQGKVLLTTGSKELNKYTKLTDFEQRLYPRFLPNAQAISECLEMGYPLKNLICMQGPFCEELNTALLKQIGASYMVTKESGKAGGFEEKLASAKAAGVQLIVIGRPTNEEGRSLDEMKDFLTNALGLEPDKREVTIVGIGMGAKENMTVEALQACKEADVVLGATRMLEICADLNKPTYAGYKYELLKEYLDTHKEYKKAVLLMSGDIGFYSGGKKMIDYLKDDYEVKTLSGISSVVYFCTKLQTSWDDVKLMSLHGKSGNLVAAVANNKKVFSLIGGKDAVGALASTLKDYGLGDVMIHVGNDLSYLEEKIIHGTASELAGQPIGGLCVILVENPKLEETKRPVTHGIEDDEFIRAKVPMTKAEIRSISLSKLALKEDSIMYDVGAGTGSVSIEAALQAVDGQVYAIEKNETACALIEENKRKFHAANIEVVPGLAPEALVDLPTPTHAFIGGSSGNMKEILDLLMNKNPKIRVVINTIALESISETLACLKEFPVKDVDIASVSIAKSRTLGRYHMMTGLNPIYIVSFTMDKEN